MSKVYVLDTNILLNLVDIFSDDKFMDGKFATTLTVIGELDHLKSSDRGEISFKARRASRTIEKMLEENTMEIFNDNLKYYKESISEHTICDDIIIATVQALIEEDEREIVFISNDLNVRLKAKALDIEVTDYEPTKRNDLDYSGMEKIYLSHEAFSSLYRNKGNKILPMTLGINENELYPNCGIILTTPESKNEIFTVYDKKQKALVNLDKLDIEIYGLKPMNREQKLFMYLLKNKDVHAVASNSLNGSGKTLISLAFAREMIEAGKADKFIYLKSLAKVEGELGYLKGDKSEKIMGETYGSLIDCVQVIYKCDRKKAEVTLGMWEESGEMEVEGISFIRGRNLDKTVLIADEIQNSTYNTVRTIMGRMTENSYVIITGDVSQQDNRFLNKFNNGLTRVINNEAFKKSEFTGSINMTKALRSPLAQLVDSMYEG